MLEDPQAISLSSLSPKENAIGQLLILLSVSSPNTKLSYLNSFRLVNTSCQTYLTVSIDGHTFTVIEADGIEHQPLPVDSLTIFAGQRYSIIVNANQTVGNYCKHTKENSSLGSFN